MLIGRTMLDGTTDHGMWAESPGEAVTFINEIIAVGSSAKLTVTLQTKQADEADSAAVAATNGTMSNLSSTGVTTQRATGLKQLWRYKFEVTASAGGSDEKFVHSLMHQPIWEVNRGRETMILGTSLAGFGLETLLPVGQTIARGSTALDYFTPWSNPLTVKGTFGCEVIALPANVTITFTIQKKFRNETDAEAKDGSSVSFTTADTKTVRETALDDLVRYKITIGGTASVGHAHLRFLAPSWEPH